MPSVRDILLPPELTDFFFPDNDETEVFPAIFLYTIWPILLVLIYPTLCVVFLIEGIVEVVFVCWLKTRRLLRHQYLSAEREPLLVQENRIEHAIRPRPLETGGYLAIDIAAVDISTLKNGALIPSLPRRFIQFPVEDPFQVAVLSWRWDFSQSNASSSDRSLNVGHAIKYAKAHGILFLFIDIISLDQTLPTGELIQHVARFGDLYTTIPVIVAYDDIRLDFDYIMLRPWIFSEIKKLLYNPYKIVYVGHLRQGTYVHKSVLHWWLGRVPRSRMTETSFVEQLRKVWVADFVTPVLELLNGHISMADIHDFKFIIPPLWGIFTAAESLPPSDYLLTVALLLSASSYGRTREYVVEGAFLTLPYTKFQIKSLVTNKERTITDMDEFMVKRVEHTEVHEICAGSVKLATFEYRHERWRKSLVPRYTVTLAPDMEKGIFAMLELGPEARSLYLGLEIERVAMLGDHDSIRNLNVAVVEQ
ncbi:uncharacterized protein N0V89_009963 [Didymosphaeria variabile]|uniref:Uncharacterized protein n=1 Tax=Didymosphaeria variabile TaxID=1932322 RepID=A0A9W9C849_9PLEO|nr:uncharacterized protein N0V89_009963 [Didymosphaeria variabile]KAJ4348585.1 hypothetical protein N0V89_009963 [Didymosphaeria variabile]